MLSLLPYLVVSSSDILESVEDRWFSKWNISFLLWFLDSDSLTEPIQPQRFFRPLFDLWSILVRPLSSSFLLRYDLSKHAGIVWTLYSTSLARMDLSNSINHCWGRSMTPKIMPYHFISKRIYYFDPFINVVIWSSDDISFVIKVTDIMWESVRRGKSFNRIFKHTDYIRLRM